MHVEKYWIDTDNIMKPNVLNPPKNHNNSDLFLLKAENWKDAYILYENVKVILPNQTWIKPLFYF